MLCMFFLNLYHLERDKIYNKKSYHNQSINQDISIRCGKIGTATGLADVLITGQFDRIVRKGGNKVFCTGSDMTEQARYTFP